MKTDALATLLPATKLAPILKRHSPPAGKSDVAAAQPEGVLSDPIATLVHSFLLWESSSQLAAQAIGRFREECVDFNELRVCLPEEIVAMLPSRYPFGEERANRLRRSLNDLYRREHKVSLDHAMAMGKREQRSYIENLDGMVPFVAARLLLYHFGQPGIPVDEQLAELFREHKLLGKDAPEGEIAPFIAQALAKQFASHEESLRTHQALVAFVDACWEKDPKAIMKNKSSRIAAHQAAERAARKEAERAAAEAARAAEAAAKAEAERAEAAKAAARAQARAEARARAAAAKAAQREAAQAAQREAQRIAQAAAEKAAQAAKAAAKGAVKGPAKGPVKGPAKASAKPVAKPVAKTPAKVAAKVPAKAAAKPAPKAATKPTAKPAPKPAPKATSKPAHKPTHKPTHKPASKPTPKPTAKQAPKKGARK